MTSAQQSNCPTPDCPNSFNLTVDDSGEERVERECENCGKIWEWEFENGELSHVREGKGTKVYESIITFGNLLFEWGAIPRNKGPQLIVVWTTVAYILLLTGSFTSSYTLGIIGLLLAVTVGSAVTFDMNYMETTGAWAPYRTFWGFITALPVLNILTSAWYLKKRNNKIS